LAALTGTAFATGTGTRNIAASFALAALACSARAATAVWTQWTPVPVLVCPGAIWDGGASVWDGGIDMDNNDGAIWDPTSPFVAPTAPLVAGWTATAAPPTGWAMVLR
jgi:CubicO group peptidase (beta-lactamase class C family)